MKKILLYLFIASSLISVAFSFPKETSPSLDIEFISSKKEYEAGDRITLQFSVSKKITPPLYYSNSYGSTLITPNYQNAVLSYDIPPVISRKSGLVNWKLIYEGHSVSGEFNIIPKTTISALETYIGPPSIEAGGTDFTMIVVIPTDTYDNPVKDSTAVAIKHQFLKNETIEQVLSTNLIAYKNIYSEKKTGRILMTSECLGLNSKEFDVNVLAAPPTSFIISTHRNHQYADGNQLTTFSTSAIKDKLGNIVSDGTYVEFFITNKSGHILKTSGTTIRGVATATMIHPDEAEQWTINASVSGFAASNTISLDYKAVISDFNIALSNNNRTITVGPLQSFMKQYVPDGLEVSLTVYNNDLLIQQFTAQSYNGFAKFNLNAQFLKTNTYQLRIEVAGLQKIVHTKLL